MEKDNLDRMTDRAVKAIMMLGILFALFLVGCLTVGVWKFLNAPFPTESAPPPTKEKAAAAAPRFYIEYPIPGNSNIVLFCDGYAGHKYLINDKGGVVKLEPTRRELYR